MAKSYVPRLSVDLDATTHARMQKLIPWGSTRHLMIALIEETLDFIEEVGVENSTLAIGAIISRRLSILDVLRDVEKANK